MKCLIEDCKNKTHKKNRCINHYLRNCGPIKTNCLICEKEMNVFPVIINEGKGKYCSRKCLGIRNSRTSQGKDHPGWKGGKCVRKDGRAFVYVKNHPMATWGGSYILEYRLIAEKLVGRYLYKHEIVHHINGDPTDNRIENLEIMTRQEHGREHTKNQVRDKETGRFLRCQ